MMAPVFRAYFSVLFITVPTLKNVECWLTVLHKIVTREFSLDIASRLDLAIARCACFRGKAICFHEEYRAYMRPYHTHRDMKPKHRYHRNHGPWDESVMWKCKRLPFVVINCECIFFPGNFSTGLSYTLIKVPS